MNRRTFLKSIGFLGSAFVMGGCSEGFTAPSKAKTSPNIVFILADDMGIDSVSALNRKSGIETPYLNKLMTEGMTFTDAHSNSAVCTPTRYGVLTGRYSWRSRLKSRIVNKWGSPLIDKDRLTVGKMLQQRGYNTACIGKWHLGLNWLDSNGKATENPEEIDFSKPVKGGPIECGFDYYFGVDVPNWPPYAWIENDSLQSVPTDGFKPLKLRGVSPGPGIPGWRTDRILPTLTQKCVDQIAASAKDESPLFLYFAMTSPHTPISPSRRFRGKSGISPYADFVMETDWSVGQLIKALDEHGLSENTLVIFTADNGTSPRCKFEELEAKGTNLRENWRGMKTDAWEGGHRVPFVAKWPGVIEPASQSSEVISLVDFMATAAEVSGFQRPDTAGEDQNS